MSDIIVKLNNLHYSEFLNHTPGTLTASSAIVVDASSRIDKIWIASAGAVRFYDTDNSNYISVTAPATVAANISYTLPGTITADAFLRTNSAGVLSWSTAVISSISGTTNQITVSGSTDITLSLPQNIHTAATPTFSALTLSAPGTSAGSVATIDGTQTLTNKSIVASQLTGTVATARLGSGTADSTTYLRGDSTWVALSFSPAWGSITGTLSAQTDLQTVLDVKVSGASNLTTVGAIPYVSAPGTLSQDTPAIHWDATNNRLGLGTASPSSTLEVNTSSASTINANVKFINTYSSTFIPLGEFLASSQSAGQESYLSLGRNAANGNRVGLSFVYFGDGSTSNRMSIGNFYNGVVGPIHILYSGYTGIGPGNTSPTGTLHVYDATPTTGVTTLTVRAGAGQSTTSLLAVQNNAGSNTFVIDSTGAPFASAFYNIVGLSQLSGSLDLFNSGTIRFSSTAQQAGAKDLGLARSSANNLAVTNGSSTNYATIGAGGIQMGTDNTYPIGASGSGRPSALFVAGAGTFGGALSVTGGITSSGGGTLTGGILSFNGSGSNIRDTADGRILVMNAAGNDFNRIQFGGTTNLFPAIKRSTTVLQFRLADDSGFTSIAASNGTFVDLAAGAGTTFLIGTDGASHAGGAVNVKIRGGGLQGTTKPLEIISNAGTTFAYADHPNTSWNASAFRVGTGTEGYWTNTTFQLPAASHIQWSASSNATSSKDLGLVRDAAGRLRISDGSTGLGQIMIASATPASTGATGVTGTIVWDASYVYVCTGTNTWKRAAIATW